MDLSSGFAIGRVRGIEIRVHWSWVLIFALLVWTLSEGLFDTVFEQWPADRRWAAGIASTMLFFASVLLHELSHALVAQRYGMQVPSITLFIFGGVSNLAGEMESARQEFRIAIAGPLMSWVLAVVFAGLWLLTTPAGISAIFGYLAAINGLLGIFNLLSGFPLDGGRVFRSILWARSKDLMQATRIASRVGVLIAYAMIGVGLVNVFVFGLLGGVWYVLVGIFLKSASEGSYMSLVVEQTLEDVDVSSAMRPRPDLVSESEEIGPLIDRRVLTNAERAFLVERGGVFAGLVTVSDLVKVPRERWAETRVGAVMIPIDRVITIEPSATLVAGLRLMQEHDVHQLPVVEDGAIVGMLTRGDVINRIQLRTAFAPSDSDASSHSLRRV
jgi:Zn-dependent protease/predicted transcriptional regulator